MKVASSQILTLLRERHPLPKWAFFAELRNSNGFTKNPRTLDAAAFNTWPSGRGLRIAYEIKVSRRDYTRELEQPDKREWAERHFQQCYFVAPSGLIDPTTLPHGWGLMKATKNLAKLRVKKLAPPLKAERAVDQRFEDCMGEIRRAADALQKLVLKDFTRKNRDG